MDRRGRRPQIVDDDPLLDHLPVGVRTASSVLFTTFLASLGVAMAGLGGPVAWGVVAAGAGLGCLPLLTRRFGREPEPPLRLARLEAEGAKRVRAAAGHADRLRELADASPEGPVAEHFHHLADAADDYVVALHGALARAEVDGIGGSAGVVRAEADRIVAQLRELVAAAEQLREAQRRRLETSPLEELTERTRRLTEAIETSTDRLPPPGEL